MTQKIAMHHCIICRAESLQRRHVSTIGRKLLNSNVSSTCSHNMANFGPKAAETCWQFWGTPANFNGFRILAAPTSFTGGQPHFARCLAVSSDATLYIHFRGFLSPNRIFARCKIHVTSKSCVLLY